ncbi:hypothetical protein [Paraburkholderia terrae]
MNSAQIQAVNPEQQGFNECPQLIIEYQFGHGLLVTETITRLIYGHSRFCNADFRWCGGSRKSIRRRSRVNRRASMRIAPGGPYNRSSFGSWLTSQDFRQAGLPFTSSIFQQSQNQMG